MKKNETIFIAGGQGMIGQALLRHFHGKGLPAISDTETGLDLLSQGTVDAFFKKEKPVYVFVTSVKIGGILANSKYPAEFIYNNIMSQTNVIHAAWRSGVKKLLYLASSCIYPKVCEQPMKEEYLLTGLMEPTSEPYAMAKIAGIKMCQAYQKQYGADFVTAIPADAYGPGDDFNPDTGHVLAALFSRIIKAKNNNKPEVIAWGTGKPRRETLFVDDLADACHFLMEQYGWQHPINIGGASDVSIGELAQTIKEVVGYKGNITFDITRPDGTMRKLLDTSRLNELGWKPKTELIEGLRRTYDWYKRQSK
jgi:GDP-L-fucose synthase